MKKIPILEPWLSKKEVDYVNKAVKSGWVSSTGEYIKKFENSFARYCNRKFGISTSNGTSALHLALIALEIKPGDEIIVPDITFVATASAVKHIGAIPVFADINKNTWNIDSEDIKAKITKKTKAIIIVHLYGNPCNIDEISKIAKENNLYVIEDAAEAHGSTYKGKMCGSFGDISCFSFFGNKIITTGEGGMCLTNNEKLRDIMNLYKNHGQSPEKRYWHPVVGFNYRMTNIQAALGCAQLERIKSILKNKRKNSAYYTKKLKEVNWLTFQKIEEGNESNYWIFTILINNKSKLSRDQISEMLNARGIDTRIMFYPISNMPPYKNEHDTPNSNEISKIGLSLPSSATLTIKEIDYICDVIKKI